MENKTEKELVDIATWDQDDNIANKAMKLLRSKFDKTYIWCEDCDGLVVKERDCCLNRINIKTTGEVVLFQKNSKFNDSGDIIEYTF